MPTLKQKAISADKGIGGAASVSVTITAGTAGSLICGAVTWSTSGSVTLSNVKDNNGVTYNIVDTANDTTDAQSCATFYLPNISGGPTSIIATFSASSSGFQRIEINEWSGIATVSPLDGHIITTPTSTGTTVTTPTFTTTVNGDLLYGVCNVSSASDITISAGSSYTIQNNGSGATINTCLADETQIQSTASSSTVATFGLSSSTAAIVGCMAFKAASVSAPFIPQITDLPPRGTIYSEWQKWTHNANTGLLQTVITQPFPYSKDWPLPRGPVYYEYWRWNESGNNLPVISTPGLVPRNYDWPYPQRITWYQSWTQSGNTTPFYPTPIFPVDQPNPRAYPRLPDYFWSDEGNVQPPFPTPFFPPNFPNPQTTTWYQSWTESGNSLTVVTQAPFAQYDWPNPKGYPGPLIQNYSRVISVPNPQPFSQSDWPLAQRIVWDRFWNQNLLENTLFPTGTPFAQYDWPLPRGNPPWIYPQHFRLSNIPAITVATLPFNQLNWPLPQTPPQPGQTWLVNLLENTLAPVLVPFNTEWSITSPPQPIDQTWVQNLAQLLSVSNLKPINQQDWPNPQRPYWNIFTGQGLPPGVIGITFGQPFNQYNWPVPIGPKPIDQTWTQALAALFPPPPPVPPVISAGRQIAESELDDLTLATHRWHQRLIDASKDQIGQEIIRHMSKIGKRGAQARWNAKPPSFKI